MSLEAVSKAWSIRGLPPTQRLILLAVSDGERDSLSIAELCDLSHRQVQIVLNRLQEAGLVDYTAEGWVPA